MLAGNLSLPGVNDADLLTFVPAASVQRDEPKSKNSNSRKTVGGAYCKYVEF